MTLPHAFPTTARAAPALTSALGLLVLAAWLVRRPYLGIVHDNRLYALQALKFNDPTVLGGDLFFKYGSQDSFTFFSPIYGSLIALLGLNHATVLLTLLGQLLWLIGALALIRAILPGAASWLALLLLITFPAVYGGLGVFGIGECFLTPRLFAEAAAMGAVAQFLRGRLWAMALLLLAGGLLHPLMIIAPVAVIFLMLVFRNRSWFAPLPLIASATLTVIIILAAARMGGLTFPPIIDPEWKGVILKRSPHLFVGQWLASDWHMLLADAVVCVVAAMFVQPLARQLFIITVAVCATSVAISYAGFDLLDNLFLGQVQLWRALWLLRVLAVIGFVVILTHPWLIKTMPQGALVMFGAFVLLLGPLVHLLGDAVIYLMAVFLFATLLLVNHRHQDAPRFRHIVMVSGAVALFLMWAFFIARFSSLFDPDIVKVEPLLATITAWDVFNSLLPSALAAAGLLLYFACSSLGGGRVLVHGLALAAFVYAAISWDRREAWSRYIESAPDIMAELPTPIAPDESVYWPSGALGVWASLGRQNFYAGIQAAGAIFNRGTAIDFAQRVRIIRPLEPEEEPDDGLLRPASAAENSSAQAKRPPELHDLIAVCAASVHPDVIILTDDVSGAPHETWRSPAELKFLVPDTRADGVPIFRDRTVQDFFIYRCKNIHAHAQTP